MEYGGLILFVTTSRKSLGPTKSPLPWAQELYLPETEGD
jgi:hypothetical protein